MNHFLAFGVATCMLVSCDQKAGVSALSSETARLSIERSGESFRVTLDQGKARIDTWSVSRLDADLGVSTAKRLVNSQLDTAATGVVFCGSSDIAVATLHAVANGLQTEAKLEVVTCFPDRKNCVDICPN